MKKITFFISLLFINMTSSHASSLSVETKSTAQEISDQKEIKENQTGFFQKILNKRLSRGYFLLLHIIITIVASGGYHYLEKNGYNWNFRIFLTIIDIIFHWGSLKMRINDGELSNGWIFIYPIEVVIQVMRFDSNFLGFSNPLVLDKFYIFFSIFILNLFYPLIYPIWAPTALDEAGGVTSKKEEVHPKIPAMDKKINKLEGTVEEKI